MNIGILSGHLTADATFTPGTDQSKNRAKFKLAVSDSYDKNLVSFYTCIAFGPKANYIGNGLQKGRFLKGCEARVEGRLNSKDFTDENGVKHTYQELTINEVESSVHKAWFENQNQQNVPNSGNNQGQQAYNGPAAPAGRSQGGQGSYYGSPQQNYNNPQGGQGSQYGTPQSNGQSYNGPQGGQDLYYGSPRGNGQNNNSQNYNGPQRGQDSHYGSPQGNGQNQYYNSPQGGQNSRFTGTPGSPSGDFSRTGGPAPLPDALPPAPDFVSGNGQGSNADGGGFHPAKFGSY